MSEASTIATKSVGSRRPIAASSRGECFTQYSTRLCSIPRDGLSAPVTMPTFCPPRYRRTIKKRTDKPERGMTRFPAYSIAHQQALPIFLGSVLTSTGSSDLSFHPPSEILLLISPVGHPIRQAQATERVLVSWPDDPEVCLVYQGRASRGGGRVLWLPCTRLRTFESCRRRTGAGRRPGGRWRTRIRGVGTCWT